MTRLGKIARLPREVREELNRRLADGEMGIRLIDWLNTLPSVQAALAAEFAGRPINGQNLSDWKQGGFEDWLAHQEAMAWAEQLVEHSDDLNAASGAIPLADRAALPMLVAVHKVLQKAEAAGDGPEQRRAVLGAAQQLGQLRRANHEAERVRIERERWAKEQEEEREKSREKEESAARGERIRARLFPHLDDDLLPRVSLPTELRACLAANARLQRARSPESESSRIKPNQA